MAAQYVKVHVQKAMWPRSEVKVHVQKAMWPRSEVKVHVQKAIWPRGGRGGHFLPHRAGELYRNWPNGRRVATLTWRLSADLRIVLHGRICVLSNRDKGRACERSRQPDPGRSQLRPERRRRGKHQARGRRGRKQAAGRQASRSKQKQQASSRQQCEQVGSRQAEAAAGRQKQASSSRRATSKQQVGS